MFRFIFIVFILISFGICHSQDYPQRGRNQYPIFDTNLSITDKHIYFKKYFNNQKNDVLVLIFSFTENCPECQKLKVAIKTRYKSDKIPDNFEIHYIENKQIDRIVFEKEISENENPPYIFLYSQDSLSNGYIMQMLKDKHENNLNDSIAPFFEISRSALYYVLDNFNIYNIIDKKLRLTDNNHIYKNSVSFFFQPITYSRYFRELLFGTTITYSNLTYSNSIYLQIEKFLQIKRWSSRKIQPRFSCGIGIGYSSVIFKLKNDEYSDSIIKIDKDMQIYTHQIVGINLHEEIYQNYLTIPVFLSLHVLKNRNLIFTSGCAFSFLSSHYNSNGNFTYYGDYKEDNGYLWSTKDNPEYGFYSNITVTRLNESPPLKKLIFSYYLSSTININIFKSTFLKFGFDYYLGLNNILELNKKENIYHTSLNKDDYTSLLLNNDFIFEDQISLKLGINYLF